MKCQQRWRSLSENPMFCVERGPHLFRSEGLSSSKLLSFLIRSGQVAATMKVMRFVSSGETPAGTIFSQLEKSGFLLSRALALACVSGVSVLYATNATLMWPKPFHANAEAGKSVMVGRASNTNQHFIAAT